MGILQRLFSKWRRVRTIDPPPSWLSLEALRGEGTYFRQVLPAPPPDPPPYRRFTTDFDQTVQSQDLDMVFGPLHPSDQATLDESVTAMRSRLNDMVSDTQDLAVQTAQRLTAEHGAQSLRDTAVTLLIDQSGSLRGEPIQWVAAATQVAETFIRTLGCTVEILGFTTSSWRGGKARARWLNQFRQPPAPGRLCDLLHIIYKPQDSVAPWQAEDMLRPGLLKENVDGEALTWAAARLGSLPQRHKVLVVISDGAPADDATLTENDAWILNRHLKQVIGDLEARGDICLGAVGVGRDIRYFYANGVTASTAELASTLIDYIARQITTACDR